MNWSSSTGIPRKSPPGLPAAGIDWTPGIGGTRWPPCRMKSMRIDFFQRRRSSLGDAAVGLEWGDRITVAEYKALNQIMFPFWGLK
jgi:hypothetical protein